MLMAINLTTLPVKAAGVDVAFACFRIGPSDKSQML